MSIGRELFFRRHKGECGAIVTTSSLGFETRRADLGEKDLFHSTGELLLDEDIVQLFVLQSVAGDENCQEFFPEAMDGLAHVADFYALWRDEDDGGQTTRKVSEKN